MLAFRNGSSLALGDNYSINMNPLGSDADYYSCLDWYGFPDRLRVDCLDLAHDAVLDGTDSADLTPLHLETASLDQFKSWIGLPDDYVRSGKATAHGHRPRHACEVRYGETGVLLEAAEHQDILLAAGCYLFGDSASVADYRRAIELRLAPFRAAVYAARRIILRPTGSLTLSGPPAVLIASELEIRPGGTLRSMTVTRILTDHLVKMPPAQIGGII